MFNRNDATSRLALAVAKGSAFYDVAKFDSTSAAPFIINASQWPHVLSAVGARDVWIVLRWQFFRSCLELFAIPSQLPCF